MNRITECDWIEKYEYMLSEVCIEIMDKREDLDTYFARKTLDELYGPGDYS